MDQVDQRDIEMFGLLHTEVHGPQPQEILATPVQNAPIQDADRPQPKEAPTQAMEIVSEPLEEDFNNEPQLPAQPEQNIEAMEGIQQHDEIATNDHEQGSSNAQEPAHVQNGTAVLENAPIVEETKEPFLSGTTPDLAIRLCTPEPAVKDEAKPEAVADAEAASIVMASIPVFVAPAQEPPVEPESSWKDDLFMSDAEHSPRQNHPKPKRAPKSAKDAHRARANPSKQKKSTLPKGIASSPRAKKGKAHTDILKNVITNNEIKGQGRGRDDSPAFEFKATETKGVLAELLQSCPKDSDKAQNNRDLATYKAALARFDKNSLKPNGEGKFILRSMRSPLYTHQIVAVAAMLGWEKSKDNTRAPGGLKRVKGVSFNGYNGGICADAMGLGKTVEMLAVMAHNKPHKSSDIRTTLIVGPSSIIKQWREEIRKHTGTTFRGIHIFQAKKGEEDEVLMGCEIVLASFAEVARSCPFPDTAAMKAFKKKKAEKNDKNNDLSQAQEEWIEEAIDSGCRPAGALHRIEWYRVVIDEAHVIKNHLTRTSLACNALNATYRWTLTGTPIMNNLEEFYPYFRFFRDPDAQSMRMFQSRYLNKKHDPSLEKLKNALSKMMIMRSINDQFLGRPLIRLPTPHEIVIQIDFPPSEFILYSVVETRIRKRINALLRQSGPDRGYQKDTPGAKAKIIALITYLRHMTAHPLLIERYVKKVFKCDKLRDIKRRILSLKKPNLRLCQHIGEWIDIAQSRNVNSDDEEEEEDLGGSICYLCEEPALFPVILPGCEDTFCRACIEESETIQISQGAEEGGCICPSCDTPFDLTTIKETALRNREASKLDHPEVKSENGKDFSGYIPRTQTPYRWLQSVDEGNETVCPGSKLDAIMDQICKWIEEAPNEKFIVFTQWLSFATIIGRKLMEKGIKFVYFTGGMNLVKKTEAIDSFEKKPEIKIMVATLKTAGVGLNLAFASRVISVDPWWNDCLERQAFGRVYRMGQERETYFVKFIIKDSVDSRIIDLQKAKRKSIDKVNKASLTEWLSVLGRVVTTKDGVVRVEGDEDDSMSGSSDEDSDDDSQQNSDFDSDAESEVDYDERFDGPA